MSAGGAAHPAARNARTATGAGRARRGGGTGAVGSSRGSRSLLLGVCSQRHRPPRSGASGADRHSVCDLRGRALLPGWAPRAPGGGRLRAGTCAPGTVRAGRAPAHGHRSARPPAGAPGGRMRAHRGARPVRTRRGRRARSPGTVRALPGRATGRAPAGHTRDGLLERAGVPGARTAGAVHPCGGSPAPGGHGDGSGAPVCAAGPPCPKASRSGTGATGCPEEAVAPPGGRVWEGRRPCAFRIGDAHAACARARCPSRARRGSRPGTARPDAPLSVRPPARGRPAPTGPAAPGAGSRWIGRDGARGMPEPGAPRGGGTPPGCTGQSARVGARPGSGPVPGSRCQSARAGAGRASGGPRTGARRPLPLPDPAPRPAGPLG